MPLNSTILKFRTALIIAFVLFLVSGCGKVIGLNDDEMLNKSPLKNGPSNVMTNNSMIETSFTLFVPCANGGLGEEVSFSGTLHFLFHITVNGNRVTIKTHFQPQGIKGTGVITGDEFKANGVTQDTQTGSLNNGSFSYNYINVVKLIGPGPGNNLSVRQTLKVTVNANGTVVVEQETNYVDCD